MAETGTTTTEAQQWAEELSSLRQLIGGRFALAEPRRPAHVPATVRFQTKAELTLALLDEARACGVQHRCVTCDADYGDNPHFLNGLEARGERYVAAVRASFSVTLGRTSQPGAASRCG